MLPVAAIPAEKRRLVLLAGAGMETDVDKELVKNSTDALAIYDALFTSGKTSCLVKIAVTAGTETSFVS